MASDDDTSYRMKDVTRLLGITRIQLNQIKRARIVVPNHDKYGVSVYDVKQFRELKRIVDGSVILTADEYTRADREGLDVNKIGKYAEAVKAMSRSKDKV